MWLKMHSERIPRPALVRDCRELQFVGYLVSKVNKVNNVPQNPGTHAPGEDR